MAEESAGESTAPEHGSEGAVRERVSDLTSFEQASGVFSLLGDPTRLRIFWLLCHTRTGVSGISEMIGMSSPAVSHHLRQLKASGLVTSERSGREVIYHAVKSKQNHFLHMMIDETLKFACCGEEE
jgi:DNA-binding transcriptional ArsR family regulator